MESEDDAAGPINLGNPIEFTIGELAQKVIEIIGSSSQLIKLPLPSDDPTQRQPDISQAKALLNWSPKIELEEGLKKTIHYFSGQMSR